MRKQGKIFMDKITIILLLITLMLIIGLVITNILKSPFEYPYFIQDFDVSGKRLPNMDDFIDKFLICDGLIKIQNHKDKIEKWKLECESKIEQCRLKEYRRKQYLECIDDTRAYKFRMQRKQTRYRQENYVKTSYKVMQVVNEKSYDYNYLVNRDKKLEAIDYECTLNEYHSKNQRKLLTNDLRKEIMLRDNFTCQICNKYMPDCVGLHIDHKIPVSKGGKTVKSNLQVLCSKCNGSKSNKIASS